MTICTNMDAAIMEAHGHLAALLNWSDMVKTHYYIVESDVERICCGPGHRCAEVM